jgi:Ca2+-transporting ATPase
MFARSPIAVDRLPSAPPSTPSWHAREPAEALAALDASAAGLTTAEAAERRARVGANAQPEPRTPSAGRRLLVQLANPLNYLLLAAAAIALVIGEWSDAVVIAIVVVLNATIGAVQEGRAEHALRGLRRLTAQLVHVLRDGREQVIDGRELVPGDIVVLAAGDAIAADARIIDDSALAAAEAALTGESTPVLKGRAAVAADTPLADRSSMAHAGTHVIAGRGRAVVVATGARTELGAIASLTATTRPPPTPLARRIAQLGRQVTVAAAVVLVVVIALGLARAMPLGTIAMIGISQVVGMVPEGLPIAMTIGLAVGVQRMASRRTIVRRLGAVETLGATSAICSDKTGTLTRNEMTVVAVHLPRRGAIAVTGVGYEPAGGFTEDGRPLDPAGEPALHRLLAAGVLCSDASVLAPTADEPRWRAVGDPTEAALVTAALKAGVVPELLRAGAPREAEVPFDSAARVMVTQHASAAGRRVIVKGAPEVVLDLCADPAERAAARAAGERMAAAALRVLAIAAVDDATIDPLLGVAALRGRATLLGLVGQIDPPREEVIAAIAACRAAGVRVLMVTGDHQATALAIAAQLGLVDRADPDAAIDGRLLEAMDDAALDRALARVRVFSRVHPAQKLRVVAACQRRGDVVAVTGDGVNDAPALVRADVGIAMGITGTEVAKDAAAVVVTDDNFATIAAAVEEGRVVHRNIKKAALLLITTGLAEVLVLVVAMLVGLPSPFVAVQILWNNLVTEGLITVNLVMEPAEGDEMRQPPVPADEPLLTRVMLARLAVLTPTIVAIVLGWFVWRLQVDEVPLAVVRSEAFTLLVVCEWFNVLNCRSHMHSALDLRGLGNRWLLGGLVVGNLLQVAVVFVPACQGVFHTVAFDAGTVIAIGAAASLVLWIEEARKALARAGARRSQRAAANGR